LEVPVTTNAGDVAVFLSSEPEIPSVLFSTYQSGKVLKEAAKLSGVRFDVGIFDETHRTTGSDGLWGLALDDVNVPISKRIFMTATPRIYAPHITKKVLENDVLLCSMDDPAIYGKPFFEMTFGDAIERGHITDYRIVVVCVTDNEVQHLINQGGSVIADGKEWDAKAFAKRVALVKAIREYGLRKIFTFHGRVKSADAFTDSNSPYSISQVARMLDQNGQQTPPNCFHVHGGMSSGVRKGYLKEFMRSDVGIMSNARCLTEGVDIPAVDAVAFIDPKRSLIDIVQATGRALRIPPKGSGYTKEKGYIFIPVFVDEDADPEKMLENSDFDSVWKVIHAMKDQDQRLEDLVSQLRVMQGKGEERTQGWRDAMAEYAEKVTFFNLPLKFDQERFIGTLYTRILEVVGESWDFWYGLLVAFSQREGHCLVSQKFITSAGYRLGNWVLNQRCRMTRLSKHQIALLESLPRWSWDAIADQWDDGYARLVTFSSDKGNCLVPPKFVMHDGYRLGNWVGTQRTKQNVVSQDRKDRLEALPGWSWDPFKDKWEEGFRHLYEYNQTYGHCWISQRHKTSSGYNLGLWVSMQRYNRDDLPQELRSRLESLSGWIWKANEEKWEIGFMKLMQYVKETGDCLVPDGYITSDGYKLGNWVGSQRFKVDTISQDRKDRLEALPGWSWDPYDDQWEQGYCHLKEYTLREGNCLVPSDHTTSSGYKLGRWVIKQRTKIHIITQRKKVLLESLPGWSWDPVGERWEEGFKHLEEYIKEEGHGAVPSTFISTDGFKLGQWAVQQRATKDKMPLDRKSRLEALSGWSWELLKDKWEEGFRHLEEYVKAKGHCTIPTTYISPDGFKLGNWAVLQRTTKDKLSQVRIDRLETLSSWSWDLFKDKWEEGFRHLKMYVEQEGHCKIPSNYISPDGYNLLSWVRRQRCIVNKMPQDWKDRLEKLPGWSWDPLGDQWEEGFLHLKIYIAAEGHSGVPTAYITLNAYKLGQWVRVQRANKNDMPQERKDRLEALPGWSWHLKSKQGTQ
jgi:superfamily II DNA or RNA helicase